MNTHLFIQIYISQISLTLSQVKEESFSAEDVEKVSKEDPDIVVLDKNTQGRTNCSC